MNKPMKATAIAPANIAFVKYWGKSNNALTLPNNASISMNLESLWTKTTVEFSPDYKEDEVWIQFHGSAMEKMDGTKKTRVIEQLDRLRKRAGVTFKAKVVSQNNFPAGVGIASSASAFCALTVAAVAALKMKVTKRQLSLLTRLGGSGSATRSVFDGFVEWKKGNDQTSYSYQLEKPEHWDLSDVILVVSTDEKKVSSLEGHELVYTSPFYKARLQSLPKRLAKIRKAIHMRDLQTLGEEIEKDAISLHAVAMSCVPPIFYLNGYTLDILQEVYALRKQGIFAYYTMDAGPNVHLICESKDAEKVRDYFKKKSFLKAIFMSHIGKGARLVDEHMF